MLTPWKKSYDNPRQHITKQRHYCADKGLPSQSYGFSSSHVWMWELDCKESCVLKSWCFWTVVLEKILESPLDCKIIADGDCSHEIKRCLLLGRNAMTNLSSVLKSSDITLLTKVHLVKVMVFPVVMYGCKSWTIKKAECWRIDAFELWCWRRLLRVPWTARESNQPILKEVLNVHWKDWCWS